MATAMLGSNSDEVSGNEGIPRFSETGTVLTEEERQAFAERRGLCYPCGRQTYKVSAFGRKKPLNNEKVQNGVCIICSPDNKGVVAMVDSRLKRSNVAKPSFSDSLYSTGTSSLGSVERRGKQNRRHRISPIPDREEGELAESERHKGNSANDSDMESVIGSSVPTATSVETELSSSLDEARISCQIDDGAGVPNNHQKVVLVSKLAQSPPALLTSKISQPPVSGIHSVECIGAFSSNKGLVPPPRCRKLRPRAEKFVNEKTSVGAFGKNPGNLASRHKKNHPADEKSSFHHRAANENACDAVRAMRRNPDSALFQIRTLKSLSLMIESSKGKDQSFPDDTIQTITQAIARHPENAEVNKMALATMKDLMCAQASLVKSVPFDELITSILQVTYNLSDFVSVQKEVCGLLSALSRNRFNGNATSLGTMFNILLDLMTLYKGDQCPFDADFQCQALIAMEGMTSLIQKHPVPLGVKDISLIFTVMYKTMEHHPTRTDILQNILAVLLNISKIHKRKIVSCGGIVAVTDAMNEHPEDEQIQEKGCEVLSVFAKDILEAKCCLQETGGIGTMISAMFTFPSNVTVQVEGCRALANLCDDKKSRMLIGSQGGSMLFVTAITEHADSVELQKAACIALKQLNPDEYTKVLADANLGSAI